MKICSKAKAAKLLKVSRATIYAMIARGELVPDELGYVDLDQLPINTDFSRRGGKSKAKNAMGQIAGGSRTKVEQKNGEPNSSLEELIRDVRLIATEQNSAIEKIRRRYEDTLHRTLKLLEENVELINNDREVIRLQNQHINNLTNFVSELQSYLNDRTKVIPVDSFNCPHCHQPILPPEEAHPEEQLQLHS
jgi:hypothetical protein